MKTTSINPIARLTGLTVIAVLLAFAAGEARAQEKGSAKGGASLLMRPTAPVTTSDYKPMSCAKCKDEYVKRTDWTARGANKPVITVARHLCAGCETTIATEGFGKAKRDVATHKCTSCGAAESSCCATAKGGGSTKGMEKKSL
jgi:heme A synthase